MELLNTLSVTGEAGAAALPPKSFRWGFGLSIAAHAALLIAAILAPIRRPDRELLPMVMVDIVVPEAPAQLEVPEPRPEPEPPPAPKTVLLRRAAAPIAAPAPAAVAPVAVEPAPVEAPASDPAPVATTAPDQSAMAPVVAAGSTAAGGGGEGATGGRIISGSTGALAAPITVAQRSSLIGRYRDQLRDRIKNGFRYPPEARDLELAGQVLVSITVNGNGHLLAARLRGLCPHALLCDDALRTVRAAAPFAAPPRELGDVLQIEIPLNYVFE